MKDTIRLGGLLQNSMANGAGTRLVVFLSGCTHKCESCQNDHLWDINSGEQMPIEYIFELIRENLPIINGVTLSGGDPFMQAKQASIIAKYAHNRGLNVWTYTGYTLEELITIGRTNKDYKALLDETDTLVDGKYIEELNESSIRYIGSSNQRIINLSEYRKENNISVA